MRISVANAVKFPQFVDEFFLQIYLHHGLISAIYRAALHLSFVIVLDNVSPWISSGPSCESCSLS